MNQKDLVRFQHMLDSVNAINSFVYGKKRKSLDTNRLLLSGIIRELEILGEAATNISKETQSFFPEIPWKQVIGMRNRLIHAYFDINPDIIWATINTSLPQLSELLKEIIKNNTNKGLKD